MSLSPAQQFLQDFSRKAQSETWTSFDPLLDKMSALLKKLNPASQEAIVLAFSLAKIYDDLGDIDQSFALLSQYNRHHKQIKTDTIADARATVATVRQLFEAQSPAPLSQRPSPRPIFILGMPRSGTSLVEQILASHSQVHGGGELKFLGQWSYGFIKLFRSNPAGIKLDDYLPELFSHYQQGIASLGDSPFLTDKMPVNFLWLGFIKAAFPDARIIHTQRDPMATCWSIYKTAFAGSSNGYSCDLADIGEFYCLYQELMAFWQQSYEQPFYCLDYERLTENQESQTRQLLDYCQLPWDPACLDFHRNSRPVKTVSWAQVKRPMYQGSSQAWRRYEKYLGPLKTSLGLSDSN